MTYEYWSNKDSWHGELLFVCVADTITEADAKFEAATGQNPRQGYTGCIPKKSPISI